MKTVAVFLKQSMYVVSCLIFSASVWAEVAVIVHPNNNSNLSKKDIERLYLAKTKTCPEGHTCTPVNQDASSSTRESFEKKLVNKSPSQMKAYWSSLIFTGKAVPFKEAKSDQEVIDMVKNDLNIIGYIDAANVTDDVKVILTF